MTIGIKSVKESLTGLTGYTGFYHIVHNDYSLFSYPQKHTVAPIAANGNMLKFMTGIRSKIHADIPTPSTSKKLFFIKNDCVNCKRDEKIP